MAVGIPIVAFRIDGVTDYIFGSMAEECLVSSREACHDAVAVLLDSDTRRQRVGSKLRARFEEEFSEDLILDKYERLFRQLSSSVRPSAPRLPLK